MKKYETCPNSKINAFEVEFFKDVPYYSTLSQNHG
jgi:hypothetical protein